MADWNVSQIYGLSQFLINKYQSNTYSPDDLFFAWNSEQRSYMQDLLGRFQNRSNGKSGANTGLIQNETILTALSPFTKNATLTINSGNANFPANHVYTLAIRFGNYRVTYINKGQTYSVQTSVIDPPSVADNKYYFTEYAGILSFLPTSITTATIDYIEDVTDIVYGFTDDGSGIPQYNAGTSTQSKWGNLANIEITKRTLKSLGVHYTSQDFENYGNVAITTGN